MSAQSHELPKQPSPKGVAAPALQEALARKPGGAPVQQDPAAAAALALAVNSARNAAGRLSAKSGGSGQAPAGPSPRSWTRPALVAAGFSLALALGWAGGTQLTPSQAAATPDWSRALAAEMRRGHEDIAALKADFAGLKAGFAALAQDVARSGDEAAARRSQAEAQAAEQIDRATRDLSARLGRLGEAVERIEDADRGQVQLAAIADRLDRIERRWVETQSRTEAPALLAKAPEPERKAEAPAPSVKAGDPEPTQTASLGEAKGEKGDARSLPVEGWALRDVYDGLALVEGKNRRLYEVAPGQILPGVGVVEKIERRGRNWVVVTSRGLIGGMNGRWW